MGGMFYNITQKRRLKYQETSRSAQIAKKEALSGNGPKPIHYINIPELNPETLMPVLPQNGFNALSLFSGGGGLDLGFERAGFKHVASYDILEICGQTLKHNRPHWTVFSGPVDGDVRGVDWRKYKDDTDVIHGGPPCQPFSISGSQRGKNDERNMWSEFIKAINVIKPKAFVAENVPGLLSKKFKSFIKQEIFDQLPNYYITYFKLNSAMFGIPQKRERVIFVGFKNKKNALSFKIPSPSYRYDHFLSKNKSKPSYYQKKLFYDNSLTKTMGVREALGLKDIGYDALSPTLRSTFTGKRNTTSILNGKSGQNYWERLQIWPNGVSENRGVARIYLPKNGHRRLSVQDCSVIQGFPTNWEFKGAVYQILGQIGNSVSPPMAYAIALNILKSLKS